MVGRIQKFIIALQSSGVVLAALALTVLLLGGCGGRSGGTSGGTTVTCSCAGLSGQALRCL
jgi:hypothetical protein